MDNKVGEAILKQLVLISSQLATQAVALNDFTERIEYIVERLEELESERRVDLYGLNGE